MYHMAPVIAEQRLRGRADAQTLRQLLAAADRDPRALRREALDVILFLLQQALRDEHGHGDVGVPVALEHAVEDLLDILPNRVAVGAHDVAALDSGIIDKLRLGAHVGEPLGEVLLHVGYLFYLLVFRHIFSPFVRALAPPYSIFHFIIPPAPCQ